MRVKLSNGDIVEINGEVVEEERTEEITEENTEETTEGKNEESTEEKTEESTEENPTTAEILGIIKKLEEKVDGEFDKIKNDFLDKIVNNNREKKIDETEKIVLDDLADLY